MNCLSKTKTKTKTHTSHWQFSRVFQHHRSGKYPRGQFPHFTAEEAATQKLRAPVHGHTAWEWQTQEAKPGLQVQVSVLHPCSLSQELPGCSNPRTTCLAWSHPPAAPSPPQSHTGQGESGEGPGMGVMDTVKVGASSSGASRPRVP